VALVARAQDATHFYQLELKKNASGTPQWWIWKDDGGTWTELASGPFAFSADTYYLLRLDVSGSSLTASVSTDYGSSFQNLGSATDSSFGSGRVGLRATGPAASFDEIRVTAR